MNCQVFIYDDTMTAVNSQKIEVIESDHFGKKIDIKMAQRPPSSAELKADIKLPSPPEPVVFWVDDTSGLYGATSLGHLNSDKTSRLDVILYSMPAPSGGGGGGGISGGAAWHIQPAIDPYQHDYLIAYPNEIKSVQGETQSPMMIANYIDQQVALRKWTDSEALAVRSLVDSAARALNMPKLDSELRHKLERWCEQLKSLGINISAKAAEKKIRGGHSQGGTQMMEAG